MPRPSVPRVKLALVPDRDHQRWYFWVGAFCLLALAFYASYRWGEYRATRAVVGISAQLDAAKASSVQAVARVEERFAVRAREMAIIEEAAQRLRDDHQELLAATAALEDRVIFYRRLASPRAANDPLAIEFFELLPGTSSQEVKYRLMVTRPQGDANQVNLTVNAFLVAGGRRIPLPVQAPRFQFRYYQALSGLWTVPAGVVPERIDVQLRVGRTVLERRFKWEVKGAR